MKILILSKKPKNFLYSSFIDYIDDMYVQNFEVHNIDPSKCHLCILNNASRLFYEQDYIESADIVIPYFTDNYPDFNLRILNHFEKNRMRVLNKSSTLKICLNRFEMLQHLNSIRGINIPKSILIKRPDELEQAIKMVGGLPVMIKISTSINNLRTLYVDDLSQAELFLDLNYLFEGMAKSGQSIIVQEFIKESRGYAFNYIVLGDKIISNFVSKKLLPFDKMVGNLLDINYEHLLDNHTIEKKVLKIAKCLKLEFGVISGVKRKEEILFFEVNPIPNIEKLKNNYNIDIIPQLLRYIVFENKL